MIIEQKECTITNSQSPLQFSLPKPDSYWNVWYRYLTIEGANVFNTGNVCSTCCCYFEYLPGDKKGNIAIAEEFSATLNTGLNSLDNKSLNQAEMLIPDGDYFVLLYTIKPKEVFFGDENDYFSNEKKILWATFGDEESVSEDDDPKTSYYRLQTKKIIIDDWFESLLVECLVPLISSQDLNKERVRFYQEQYRQGIIPTAFSVAIWDKKAPDVPNERHSNYDPDLRGHDLLAHYIIDGHHKIYAAALENKEITLLTYIRKDNYFGTKITQKEIDFLATPNEKHERDIWLETLKDPKVDIENKLKTIELLHPYFNFKKVKHLMIEIAKSSDNEKLAYAAGMLVARNWDEIYPYYLPKERRNIFKTLHSEAQEIVMCRNGISPENLRG